MKINYNNVKGVIHVGASTGQETSDSGIKFYDSYDLNVVWVEPIPSVYNILKQNIKNFKKQYALNALISDVEGKEYDFFITNNNGESSSIFELAEHRDIWPNVSCIGKATMIGRTLTALLTENEINIDDYDCLVLDTQGSELLVLSGCIDILSKFKYINMEVADFESYKDCCKLTEVDAFFKENGFKRTNLTPWNKGHPTGDYYDALYIKK